MRRFALFVLAGLCSVSLSASPNWAQDTAAKPAESKPAEAKPAETKPAEAKPAEVKPAEAKPAEGKPAESKPAESKPAEVKPGDAKPAAPAADAGIPKGPLPGHSYHGEVFDEGPRQAAYLMPGMPTIKFPTTSKHPDAQKFIEQGLGQLHGFWFLEAERSFRQAASLDHDCAIAYWGMAMANFDNDKRAKGFSEEAMKRKDKASERERMYIEALDKLLKADRGKNKERYEAYTRALDKIVYKFPDDIEAKSLIALRLWRNREVGTSIASYLAVDALLSDVFKADPMHPAHHYRIHLWDDEKADNALASAAVCGQTSPGIAHMWHMSGHIFSRLKRYDDGAWQQEASARVDHAHMMRDRVMPDQIHNFAHNNEWLIRNLIHIGRVRAGVDLARNMIELPRHPKYNSVERRGSSFLGRQRLFDVLTTYELWDELIALCGTPYLEPTDKPDEQLKRLRALGMAYYRKGDVASGNVQLTELQSRLDVEKDAQEKAGIAAEQKAKSENKEKKDVDKARNDARNPFTGKIQNLERAVAELEGHQAMAVGDAKKALALLRKGGGVNQGYLALVQLLAGEKDEAEKAARQNVTNNANEVQPLAVLVDILWRMDKKKEAGETFQQLRDISGSIDDLSAPPFARLAPIAKELQLPDDWRVIKSPKPDVGNRPPLDQLGPFRWSPSPAPDYSLVDADGKPHTLKEYQGKPVVVIFYLGYGCLHCAEQLQAFGPRVKEFQDAGISVVAISSDDQAGLKQSIQNYKDGPIPIPLLSNADLSAFKAYRCHDDFEKKPLHGTFVIDGAGLIRWQDISYEPFMDPSFVLNEARRLLAQSAAANLKVANTAK